MSAPAHPEAMAPRKPGATRTAPPRRPNKFPTGGRYLAYTLFDWTGLLYLVLGFLVLHVVWSLGSGQEPFESVIADFENPIYIAFHVFALVGVVFVGVRFFRLFPKAQPPRIGPAKPPPAPVISAMLYGAWIAVAGLLTVILSGGLF